MTERLTLAEAQDRARIALLALYEAEQEAALGMIHLADWEVLRPSFVIELATIPHGLVSPAVAAAFRAVARAFLGYCAHRDFEVGAKAERANAVTLLRQEAAYFEANERAAVDDRQRGECAVRKTALAQMAYRLERGERVGQ